MVRLNNGENIVALTLTEFVTIADPVFLFEFTTTQTQQKYYCIANDTSLYPERYNKFTITVKDNPDPLNGELSLVLGSEYTYTVYQQTSSTNLDPAQTQGIVEVGFMTYEKYIAPREEYENTNNERRAYVRD